MGPYGQKMVKLICQAGKKTQGFFKKYTSILALLLPIIYGNLRKIVRGKKVSQYP